MVTPAKAPAKGRRTYHHGDLKNALLEAGRALLAEGGTPALSLREAARRAGVSHAAPYRHFASREALLAAIAEGGFAALAAELERAAARGRTPLERLRRMGEGYVGFALAHPAEVQTMFGAFQGDPGAWPPGLPAAAQRAFGLLVGAVAAAQEAGQVAGRDPLPGAVAAWSAVHGVALLLLQNGLAVAGFGKGDAGRAASTVMSAVIEGLRVR
jgi:AcrR family transcriptional regulator